MDKVAFRSLLLNNIACLSADDRVESCNKLFDNFVYWFKSVTIPKKTHIAGFYPKNNEINTLAILAYLRGKGFVTLLPAVTDKNTMIFRYFMEDTALKRNYWGIYEPYDTLAGVPEIVLAPLVGFDLLGNRLGYGGGYYDRVMYRLKKTNSNICYIGLAYDIQRVDNIHVKNHDVPLQMVITDEKIYDFTSDNKSKE